MLSYEGIEGFRLEDLWELSFERFKFEVEENLIRLSVCLINAFLLCKSRLFSLFLR